MEDSDFNPPKPFVKAPVGDLPLGEPVAEYSAPSFDQPSPCSNQARCGKSGKYTKGSKRASNLKF